MRAQIRMVLFLSAAIVPCYADFTTTAQVCSESNTTLVNCSSTNGSSTATAGLTATTPNPGAPDQVFVGSSSAFSSVGTWKLSDVVNVTDYRRDMFVSNPSSFPAANSSAFLNDTITATGGTGTYSLRYVLSLDGSLTSTDPSIFASLLFGGLSLSAGTQTASSGISLDVRSGQPVPTTVTLTYDNVPFDQSIASTLNFNAGVVILPLLPSDVPTIGANTITGGAAVNFASTIHLTELLITDANGNPIPDVTITSANGYNYTLDPANLPESSAWIPLILGLFILAGWWQRRPHLLD